ncbi:hypothetical protein B0A69_03345 [Chryseobacterium shigense]|uniref:DUF7832 domain-containing protein n=1 Tax=Chryseobacterium shigense TaxID=297244 RepID=A0A1N7I7G1_9FLAO|nr:hypothetical protein [Chryseobacterium shigense]PQA97095.1 hypothetical protein B0A69_03345 [Chryseobacterium shigense]SIS33013.1 hypothetical protein SAMN05421639_102462 [Chryseobacterium shigense]
MAKYDDASWHYGGEYPENLPDENAATHIGMFLAWCINNDLISEELAEDSADEIQSVKRREMTGGEFLIDVCDEKFSEYDLSAQGNGFAQAYYNDGTAFGKKFNSFADDYSETFDRKAEENNFEYESFYHVEDTYENYDLIKPLIDQRFEEWKEFAGV